MKETETLLKRGCAAVFASLLFLAARVPAASAAPAGEVAVICDQQVAPHRALLESFTKACNFTVRVIPPEEARRDGFEQRLQASGVRAVLAIGLQARASVEGLRELPVLLTMVPSPAPWIGAQPNRFGIEMALSPQQHLETLLRVFPRARRIGLVFDPEQTGGYVREARAAAAARNLKLETREIERPGELPRRLAEVRELVDVLWVLPDPTVLQAENLDLLLLASFESRLPLYAFARKYVEMGAIAAAHLDPAALGVQAAEMLHCLASPAPGSVQRWEYARGAQLVLNQKVARKMGIVLDPDVLESAADVLR